MSVTTTLALTMTTTTGCASGESVRAVMDPRGVITDLLSDEEYREAQAEASYYRERLEEAALDQEHDTSGDYAYVCLAWDDLSDFAKRPFRTAVATVCDSLAEMARAA